jgi:Flp pilus assembly protein TadD
MRHTPQSPRAYERLARLQLVDGEVDAALETLQIGVDATGRNLLLLQTLGLAQEQRGDIDAAMAAYEEVLARAPGAAVSANNLAMLIANRQADDPARLARAREITEQFEESEQPVLIDTAGWVQYRSGNYGRSVELLEKAAGLGLEAPEHEYHLGMAYLKVGRIDEGRALLAQAIDSGTDFPGIEEARAALQDTP